tara:strand:+ start:1854 stop:2054 length:201 start_codon:yes stop_codon:yes gene_type:complete
MEDINVEEVRRWLRKMYTCQWTYGDNTVTIVCDGEEFNIRPDRLNKEEEIMLKKILNQQGHLNLIY